MTRYLVTGASGELGQLAVAELAQLVGPAAIVALVRSDAAATAYAAQGIATRRGDYDDRASLEAAFAGVDRLLFISSSAIGSRLVQHANVVAAAQGAGVGFIAYTSLLGPAARAMRIGAEHVATEAMLADSGIPHTLLRNGWYIENVLMGLPQALAAGQIYGSSGEGRFSPATRADYAAAAAVVLNGGHDGAVLELGGDEAFTMGEFAATLSQLSGRTIGFVSIPEAALAAVMVQAGLPATVAEVLADADARAARDLLFAPAGGLSGLLGRPTTSYATVLRAALADVAAVT
ncbi:NmrA family NAD(P)-binding protein [Novosphingobium piscinae]|uniref:NmrA family NAD(P)-binding protein n=1 Tax=Novosphingobium piscinae TaxID=1507448 RepID=A0A7X1G0V9_9SPHN|nr:NmrA family NAD(P)-binding protein [Novosphingobium piscinae]MBC2670610.1 NmrA family NAD(P)-binding protein [Novosphingobium piscinae]